MDSKRNDDEYPLHPLFGECGRYIPGETKINQCSKYVWKPQCDRVGAKILKEHQVRKEFRMWLLASTTAFGGKNRPVWTYMKKVAASSIENWTNQARSQM